MKKNTRPKSGYTMIEIMVVLAIVVSVILVSVPGYRSMVQNNRAAVLSNTLNAALRLARSEAIKRQETVSVCASNKAANPDGCDPDNAAWSNGWIVYSGTGAFISGTSELIHVEQPIKGGFVVAPSANTIVSFFDSGFASQQTIFSIAPNGCTATNGRQLTIEPAGFVTLSNIPCP